MKPWNAWVACLGCAGLCLALLGCGGKNQPDSASDTQVATETSPSPEPIAPPAVVQNDPQPQPAPSEPAPAPSPAPTPEVAAAPAATTPAMAPAASGSTTEPPKAESVAMSKPAGDAPKAAESAEGTKPSGPASTTPATPETPAAAPVAEAKPSPTPAADAAAADNPFAVFSETSSTASTAGSTPPAAGGTAEGAPDGAPAGTTPPAGGDRPDGALGYLNAAGAGDRGSATGKYRDPVTAAMTFLEAVKAKNLAKMAEATALRAPLEASTRNQKIFSAILEQDLATEDLDELAKKLDGYTYAGSNQAKSSGKLGVIFTRSEGTSVMRRTITMRHEKAGWKVLDIGGQGEIEKPIVMPRMRGGTGGRR